MAQFKDNTGRAWPIVVDVGAVKRVRSLCGVNLLDAGDPKSDTMAKLVGDFVTLIDVITVICQPDAEKNNLSDEEFGKLLRGDAIAEAADALLEAITDFFPQPQKGLLLKVIAKSKQVQQAQKIAAEKAGEQIDALDPNDLLAKLSTQSAGSSPGVSASTLSI